MSGINVNGMCGERAIPVEPDTLTCRLARTADTLGEVARVIIQIREKLTGPYPVEGGNIEKEPLGAYNQAEINAERANLILNEIINLRDIL